MLPVCEDVLDPTVVQFDLEQELSKVNSELPMPKCFAIDREKEETTMPNEMAATQPSKTLDRPSTPTPRKRTVTLRCEETLTPDLLSSTSTAPKSMAEETFSFLREMIAKNLNAQGGHQALEHQLFGILKSFLESLGHACHTSTRQE